MFQCSGHLGPPDGLPGCQRNLLPPNLNLNQEKHLLSCSPHGRTASHCIKRGCPPETHLRRSQSPMDFLSCLLHFHGSLHKEPAAKVSKGVKGKKEEKQEAGKEGTAAPSENGDTKTEEAQKTESVANEGE
uniref:High mobility group nucleosome-binding domain-containing protein 3 n=1 Tax=Bos mutus grunniens TaxID=30521 RepID=A0A8B9WI43_BOSMU